MKIILPVLLICLWGGHAFGKEPVSIKSAFLILKYGTVELEDKDGKKREVSYQPGSEESNQPMTFRFSEGETVRMKKDADCSLMMPEAGTVMLQSATAVRLPDNVSSEKKSAASLELLGGKLFLAIDGAKLEAKGKEFRLKTPTTILAVKGTQFFVETGEDFETAGVHEGRVLMVERESGKSVDIGLGKAAMAKPGAVTETRPMTAEERALSEVYQGFAVVTVPAERNNRRVDGGGNVAEKGEEIDSGTAVKVIIEPFKPWMDNHVVATLKLTERIKSEPLGIYFSARYQEVPQFCPRAAVEWNGMAYTMPSRFWVDRPPGTEPGDWVSYFVPFTQKSEAVETDEYGTIKLEANVIPASKKLGLDGKKTDETPEWSIEIGPVFYVLKAEE